MVTSHRDRGPELLQRLDGVLEGLQRGCGVAAEARQIGKRAEAGELREHVDQGD